MSSIRLAGIIRESIVDGPGIRFVVFVQGCPHHCEGCHNPQSHDFSGGFETDTDRIFEEIKKDPLIQGVTFSGGEPFCQPAALAELASRIKNELGLGVMSFSGFTLEELLKLGEKNPQIIRLLKQLDYLVDGRFVLALKDIGLLFRGSSNQRILDVPLSLASGRAVNAELKSAREDDGKFTRGMY